MESVATTFCLPAEWHTPGVLRVFLGVLADEIGTLFQASRERPEDEEPRASLFHALATEAELSPRRLVGNAWQNHLLDRIVNDENAFSSKAQRTGLNGMGAGLLAAAKADLVELRALFDEDLQLGELTALGDAEPAA